ncbi:unnamed protein product [Cladocopium goreaui]|uniref:Titin homolog n=1 Tax=Cladocopium goreaui TaxID=2562237 RepID=A0A9P1CVK8_9DINO|nr:unnamed protein product [Cladocopium goreaui]
MPQEGRFFLDPQKFSILADRVRSWAPAILAHCNDEDESRALRMDILDTISFLERGQRCLETKTSGHVQYPSQTLISAACLGNLLGSNEHVCNVVPLSLQVALPGVDLSNLLRNASFPKASTIGRAGSALDFAFLLECRERWCNVPCLHYAWADSSPQCGREWFMLMHTSVCMDAVVNACNAANMLTRCRPDLSDHFEAEDADVEQQPRLHTVLLDAIHTHKCIPVALGSGKVSVEDKTSCLLHAMSLECSSRVGLRCHLDNVVSWTTDLGVEAQLPQFQAKHLDSILPTYVHQTLESDLADEDQETVGDADAFPIMPKALLTPGGLHITHNARQDLRTKMLWFDKFWDHLKAVAALLVPQHLRERIIARLVRGTASAEHEHLFASLSLPALYEKRWQVVAKFLKNLLPHFRLLKRVWNLQDFLIDGKDAEGDVGASFDVALADPMFCSYVFMVDGVQNILLNLERWLENCACHEHLFTTLSSKRQRKKRGQLFGGAVRFVDCPMRGKRAPELAAGKLEDTIAELSTAALNLFSDQMDFRITPADRAVLMQDFDFAKQHLHVVLVAKFGFWRQIPWRLAGLSHHWPSVARRIAQDCLEEFDASMSKPGMTLEHHHPLSVRFLSETGMREDLQRFANGGCMTDQLMFAVASLRFIPVVERCVEALHRDVKVAAKHIRLGPTKVSLSFRMREILDLSSFEEGFPARLQPCFDLTRQPKKAAAALGLLSHPIFLPLLRDGCTDVCVWLAALVRAVHRCDLETQFSDMHEARSTHFRKRKVLEAEAEKLHDTKLSVPRTYEDIFKRAIVDHFRAMAGSDVFFTLPVLVDDSAGYEVAPFLGPAEKRLCLRGADEEPLEIVEMAEGADHGREELHFRLLHGFPARMKSMLRPVASTPVFAKDAVMIAVHKCVYNAEGLPNIRQSDLVECVTHLLNARALPGLVCRSGQSDRILMSECALPQVRVMCPLHEPKQVCSLRNSDISQYDLMELILALEQNGWSWKKMPSKKNAREALCHEPGKELVWYSQSHSVSKAYLQCLLLSDDLFEKGLARIPHWVEKPGEIYPALLKGEGPQPGRAVPMPALEPDIPVEALQDVAVAEPGQAVAHLSLQEFSKCVRALKMWCNSMAGQTLLTQLMPLVLETVQKAPLRLSCLLMASFAPDIDDEDVSISDQQDTPQKGTSGKEPDSAESKFKGRHKVETTKKGAKTCRACQKSRPLSDFALNQTVDKDCKKALDVISKKARQQGKVEWFKNVKADPKKLRSLVTSYRQASQEAEKAGQKKSTWNLAEYIEEVRASTETVGTSRGKMMWQDQAIEFWRSTDGGALTKQEAASKWDELVATYEALGIPHDHKGPAKASLRLRIHTEDLVDDVKRVAKEKKVVMHGQQTKKATAEDVEKMSKSLMVNHDKIQGGVSESEAARSFVSSDNMDGISITLNDVSLLVPDEDAQDEAEEDAEEKDEEGEEDTTEKKSKKKWFDRDREVNKAQRQMSTALSQVQTKASAVKEQLEKVLAEVAALPTNQQESLKGEEVIVQARLECLQKLYGSEEALQTHIRSIASKALSSARSSTGTAADPSICLGLAAPCQSYQKLITFEACKSTAGRVLDCSDLEGIERVKKEAADARSPIVELVSACKSATGDITKALKLVRDGPKKAKAAAKNAAHRSVTSLTPSDVFKHSESSQKVQVVEQIEEDPVKEEAFNPDVPVMFACKADEHASFEKEDCVKRFMFTDFLTVFSSQGPAQKCDRAHRRFPAGSDIADVVSKRLRYICSAACPTPDELQNNESLTQSLEAMAVIIGKNTVTCSPEKSHAGSLRLGLQGTREVILVREKLLYDVLGQPTLKAAKQALLGMDDALAAKLKLYSCTLGKGQALYTPPGWIFVERVMSEMHWVGFRAGCCITSLQISSDLKWLSQSWAMDDPVILSFLKVTDEVLHSAPVTPAVQRRAPLEVKSDMADAAEAGIEAARMAEDEAKKKDEAQRLQEEADRGAKEVEEAQRLQDEADRQAKEAEEARRLQEEADRKAKEAEEAQRLQDEADRKVKEAEAAQRLQEEADRQAKEAEEAQRLQDEADRQAKEAEKARRLQEEADRKAKEAEEAQRLQEEADRKAKEAEEDQRLQKEADRKAKEAEAAQRLQEEADRKAKEAECKVKEEEKAKKLKEEADRKAKQAEAARKAKDSETRRLEKDKKAKKDTKEAQKPNVADDPASKRRRTKLQNLSTSQKNIKLHLTTAYSGVGFGEAAAAMVADAFNRLSLFKVEVVLHSQTEIDSACQEVLSAPHVFVDLCHRVDTHVVATLKKMQEQKRKRLQQDPNLSKGTLGREFLKEAAAYLNGLDSSVFCTFAWCCKCNAFCEWAPQVGPSQDGLIELWLELAGNTCTPWSARGKGLGYLDEASIPSFIWAFSLKKTSRSPDAVVNECTPRWPATEFFSEVFDDAVVETANFSPTDMGIPVNRPRAYSIVTLNELTQKKPYRFGVELLQKVAFCNLILKGSVFLTASEEEVGEYMNGLAERRSLPERVDGRPYRCLAVMDFGDRQRLQQYVEMLQSKHPISFDWDINVDLAQAPPFGSAHTVLPTIIRNSKLYNMKEKRFFCQENC